MLALQKWLLREAVSCFIFAQSGKFHPQIRDLRRVGCDCLKNSPRTNVQKTVAPTTQGPRSLCLFLLVTFPDFLFYLYPSYTRWSLEGITAPGTTSGMIYKESVYNVPFSFSHSLGHSLFIYSSEQNFLLLSNTCYRISCFSNYKMLTSFVLFLWRPSKAGFLKNYVAW